MKQLVKFGFILGAICMIATLVLAVTYEVTKPRIDKQLKEEEYEALKFILPEADSFNEKNIDGIDYYEAIDNNKTVGYCIKTAGQGYGGFIRMLIGIDINGKIEGVEILEQYETPGLGARIIEVRPGEKRPWFLNQFKGKTSAGIEVRKDIDAITGATISSRAVSDTIKKAIDSFMPKIKK